MDQELPAPRPKAGRISAKRLLRSVPYLLAAVGGSVAIFVSRGQTNALTAQAFLLSFALAAAHLIFAARQWACVLEAESDERDSIYRSVFLSQAAKYLPIGGFAQAAIQISASADKEEGLERARRYPASALLTLIGAAVVGLPVAFDPAARALARAGAVTMLCVVLLLHPSIFRAANRLLRRLSRRFSLSITLPPAPVVRRSVAWSVANLAATALSFGVVLRSMDSSHSLLTVSAAFSMAWAAGFLVLPIPGGLGIRESVLILALPSITVSTMVSAALAHRFVMLCAELSVLTIHELYTFARTRNAANG